MMIETVAQHLIKEMTERFKHVERSLTITVCTFIDPRFKFHVFDDQNSIKITQQHVTVCVTRIIEKKTDLKFLQLDSARKTK